MHSRATRLPFDPELEVILVAVSDQIPRVALDTIPALRKAPAPDSSPTTNWRPSMR